MHGRSYLAWKSLYKWFFSTSPSWGNALLGFYWSCPPTALSWRPGMARPRFSCGRWGLLMTFIWTGDKQASNSSSDFLSLFPFKEVLKSLINLEARQRKMECVVNCFLLGGGGALIDEPTNRLTAASRQTDRKTYEWTSKGMNSWISRQTNGLTNAQE